MSLEFLESRYPFLLRLINFTGSSNISEIENVDFKFEKNRI